ncbi:MAG: ribbon-helix-helix protein, CopG family, partial [Hyphomonas sp.]|nr:ribbon-helix-helix protein, CopG family [Hyphomonas sp.]
MSKPRVNLRLSHKLYAELDRRAREPGVTKTDIVEEALSRFFDPESNLVLEERLLRRMDAFDRRQGEIERDTALCLETIAHFVFYWLTQTEPIPEGQRDAAHALGQRRFDHFIQQVARKLGNERGV